MTANFHPNHIGGFNPIIFLIFIHFHVTLAMNQLQKNIFYNQKSAKIAGSSQLKE